MKPTDEELQHAWSECALREEAIRQRMGFSDYVVILPASPGWIVKCGDEYIGYAPGLGRTPHGAVIDLAKQWNKVAPVCFWELYQKARTGG